jgi:large subunit ribosomal protein L35
MKDKTHKGMKKRVRVSKTGKVKRRQSGARHLKSSKTSKRKRKLRGTSVVTGKRARRMRAGLT